MTTLIIPMAGNGQRFRDMGYINPKPFIHVTADERGTMVDLVIESLYQYVTRIVLLGKPEYEHRSKSLRRYYGEHKCEFVAVGDTTNRMGLKGAALTVRQALGHVRGDSPVWVVNCDNLLLDRPFIRKMVDGASSFDGVIPLVPIADKNDVKWSFASTETQFTHDSAKIEFQGVTRVVEKQRISDLATAGYYYFRSWDLLEDGIRRMIEAEDRHNGEFYLAPVYNYILQDKSAQVWGPQTELKHYLPMGTPEDLENARAKLDPHSSQ